MFHFELMFTQANTLFFTASCVACKYEPPHLGHPSIFIVVFCSFRRNITLYPHCFRRNNTLNRVVSAGGAPSLSQSVSSQRCTSVGREVRHRQFTAHVPHKALVSTPLISTPRATAMRILLHGACLQSLSCVAQGAVEKSRSCTTPPS